MLDLVRELDRPFGALDTLFEGLFTPRTLTRWNPRMDISDDGTKFIVDLEIPGITKSDLNITVEGDRLIVSGEKNTQREMADDTTGSFHQERFFGSFRRSVRLRGAVDADNITAEINNGILTIELPKIEPTTPSTRNIEIKEIN